MYFILYFLVYDWFQVWFDEDLNIDIIDFFKVFFYIFVFSFLVMSFYWFRVNYREVVRIFYIRIFVSIFDCNIYFIYYIL